MSVSFLLALMLSPGTANKLNILSLLKCGVGLNSFLEDRLVACCWGGYASGSDTDGGASESVKE